MLLLVEVLELLAALPSVGGKLAAAVALPCTRCLSDGGLLCATPLLFLSPLLGLDLASLLFVSARLLFPLASLLQLNLLHDLPYLTLSLLSLVGNQLVAGDTRSLFLLSVPFFLGLQTRHFKNERRGSCIDAAQVKVET
jgi:hypothetical protein